MFFSVASFDSFQIFFLSYRPVLLSAPSTLGINWVSKCAVIRSTLGNLGHGHMITED